MSTHTKSDEAHFVKEGRVINFAAGPSALPLSVLQSIQKDLLNWNGTGVSILEIGHRGSDFKRIITEAENDLRKLLNIPENYSVLFMQGGGTGQFAAVPLNMVSSKEDQVDYLVTGGWSQKAAQEAEKFAKVNIVFDGSGDQFVSVPANIHCDPKSKYFYYCVNETIHGVEFSELPIKAGQGGDDSFRPTFIADMSSNFCSRAINVSDYGIIFAGAQKNAGIAGLVVVIIRKDLLEKSPKNIPTALCYASTDAGSSILNTPPTFAIYASGLIFKWLLEQGGIEVVEKKNIEKAGIVYDFIDQSNGFYCNKVQKEYRSRMNVPLRIDGGNAQMEAKFIKQAAAAGLVSLGGHHSVGGIRISLYNAITLEDVKKLIQFMAKFQLEHDKAN